MRTFRAAAALAVIAVLLPGVATVSAKTLLPAGTVTYDAAGTARLYVLVNAHRVSMGLPALTVNSRLEGVARAWTTSMATSGKLAHNDALFTKAMHSLLRIATFGENVAYASLGVERAHVVLLNSPHHRENIESPKYAVAGFAVVRDAKGVTWVTEDFGSSPMSAVAPRPAPRPVATAAPAPAPRRAAPAPTTVRAATPVTKAAPAWVAPAAPRREETAGGVDIPSGPAGLAGAGLEQGIAPAAASGPTGGAPGGAGRPLALVALAALLVAARFTVAGARRS